MLDTLLERGAVIDAVDNTGDSAFHYACSQGNADCALTLAKVGCDITLRDINGETGKEIRRSPSAKAAPRTRSC